MANREINESEMTQFILDTLDGDLARKIFDVANFHNDEHGFEGVDADMTTTLACMALIVGLCRNDELGVRLLEEVYEIRETWIDQAKGVKH